jgi:putative peptide zinc metalloprotease protein
MSSLEQFSSATSRPLPLLKRRDLIVEPLEYSTGRQWSVKDPLSLRYWHLADEEWFLYQSLDGKTSADELRRRFDRRFAPRRLSAQQLSGFVANLHREGLLVGDRPGQDQELCRRLRQWKRDRWKRAFFSLLAIRVPGVDPDRILNRIAPRFGWLFTPLARSLYLLLLLSAALLVAVQWPLVLAEFPRLTDVFTLQTGFLILAAIGLVKIFHELGHAIACKHSGAECHEIGLMFLVGAPCLYCDVSDSWLLPNKWPRIAISAAGIIVELGLAAIAAWLWWFTYPGLLHSLCLQVMLVCSINTLLVNGNPLLQYDGYFILADWSETPNLRQQSAAVLRRWLARALLGLVLDDERLSAGGRQIWLGLYAIASAIYRWVLAVAMVWLVHQALLPYDIEILSVFLGAMFMITLLGVPLVQLVRFLRNPSRTTEVRWNFVAARAALVVAIVAGLLSIPMPHQVAAPAVVEPRGACDVFVTTAGRLQWAAQPGARVAINEPLARLKNADLEREVERLSGERNQRAQRLSGLIRRQAGAEAAAELPAAEKALADVEERLRRRREELDRLVIRAPRAGIVYPPPDRAGLNSESKQPCWQGSPLDPKNLGCTLEAGDLLCVVGDAERHEAVVYVEESDAPFVEPDRYVRLWLDQFPNRRFTGTVTSDPQSAIYDAPTELAARREVQLTEASEQKQRLLNPLYPVRVTLDPSDCELLIGASGRAKISSPPQSLGGRLIRGLERTFRFEW